MKTRKRIQYVALLTFSPGNHERFYEEGGVYDDEPCCSAELGGRRLGVNERTVECPRCGHRFVATENNTAEANRDLHFDGDEDIPSICRHLPSRPSGLLQAV